MDKDTETIYKVQAPLKYRGKAVDGFGVNLITPVAMSPWQAFIWAMKDKFGSDIFFFDKAGDEATINDKCIFVVEMSDSDEDDIWNYKYVVLAEVDDWRTLISHLSEDKLMKLMNAPMLPIGWSDCEVTHEF